MSTAEEVKKEMKMSQEDIAKRKEEERDLGALMVIESQLIQQFNHGVVDKAEDKRMLHDQAKAILRKNKRIEQAAARGEAMTEDQILESDSAPMITKIATGSIRDSGVKIPERAEPEEAEEEAEKHTSSQHRRRRK